LQANIADTASFYVLMTTTAGKYPHLRQYTITSEKAPAEMALYENPTVTANGTETVCKNNNRNASETPSITVYINPTVTDDGTQLEHRLIVGSKQTGGSGDIIPVEWITKPADTYLLKYTNNSGQISSISWLLFWYETN